MKRYLAILLAFMVLLSFVSCEKEYSNKNSPETETDANAGGSDNKDDLQSESGTFAEPQEHSHQFVKKIETEPYFKSAASCTQGTQYFYSCSCGAVGNKVFTVGVPIAHTVIDGCCTICKKTATQGLAFTRNDNQTYTVSGIGNVKDSDIIIPSQYNGLDVVKIGDMAFENCKHIKRIVLPETIKTVGIWSFLNCTGLTEINLPKSVQTLSSTAFTGCSNLERITVDSENENYYAEGNCVISSSRKLLILGIKTSIIPNTENVTAIAENAFADCSGLTEITIPENITSIQSQAFAGCSSLKKITLSSSVKLIGNSAFANCTSLETIVFQGKKSEWDSIVKRADWDYRTGNYKVICQP